MLALLGAGCALAWFGTGERPFVFSHRVHVTDAGLECGDCHGTWQSADDPGMPVVAQCMLCHTEIDANKPPARHVEGLFADGRYQAAHHSRLSSEIVFSHQSHATRSQQCSECHRDIEHNERVDGSLAVGMAACRACHAKGPAPDDCAGCHREQRLDRPPASHALFWRQRHGPIARAHGGATADDCTLCHQEATCTSCHLEQAPDNHNGYFRLRGHGLHARMDRQNCAACHRSDSCDSCHRTTEPMSHLGATWGGSRNNHCISCHTLTRENDCATCHSATPSHDQATPMPAWHNPGMNCRQCHGLSVPLHHVDKGDVCIECHR